MNGAPQRPDTLTVYDTDLEDAVAAAFGEIRGHQVFHLPRLKGVQIENTVNEELGRVVVEVHRLTGNRYVPDLCRALLGLARAA